MPRIPRRLPALFPILLLGCSSHVPVAADLSEAGFGSEERGRSIVERSIEAHGGQAAWDALEDVRFQIDDDWHGVASASAPWPVSDPATLRYTYNFDLNKGRIEFPEDPTLVWGHDSIDPWVEMSGERIYEDLEDVRFIVPTEAYFVALPFKFLDPGTRLVDAGPRELDGQTYDTVLVSFDTGVGVVQDRYLAYFDPETGRFAHTIFTIYEQSELLEGYARYSEWQQVDALLMPRRIEIGAVRPFEMAAHTIVLSDVQLSAQVDRRIYEKPDAR